ncbi:AAA family ATPase [Paenibacillus macerans]|uniref:ATP-dependent nuclease n=1 Tax=Paenibacillus macerans TaxID=44252 RepID=UPI00242FB752|nr:AAA family ATPase [Paenibacillus macerans]MBS5913486.1 AAA family ATPase [Paenibacillus macerans]MEC0140499.1 AAA family ATPase [Paenibacillus macerans]UMV45356.1 AAA family ATPase [Paenibacillus macerans]
MHISSLSITGYKNSKEKSLIKLHKGLNVLVGENGSGKTTIVNALRLILRENEFSYMNINEDDFYVSLDKKYSAPNIKIDLTFDSLSPDEQVTFLTWCDADFNAQLHLEVSSNPNRKGYFKKEIWGGVSKSSIFEEETFECIDCIYLPPLRDAEEKLVNGKRSRLAQLLKKQYGDKKDELVQSVKSFNEQITSNADKKYNEIEIAKQNINAKLEETLGQRLGQSINLQFAETTFNKIVESIKMVFFPGIKESNPDKFRDIATNSLGYNNLLYIATVFAELELLKDNNMMTVLLIEEPEAHLHPQLQVKFIKYLEEISRTLENIQVVITTHSPVLASSIKIDNLIHVIQKGDAIITTVLKDIDLGESSKNYINRWLDVTKSTLLFSKGIILVEGISEAMLIPTFAKIVLAQYNKKALADIKEILPNSLEEAGVSTVNINGINFKHFMKLFANCDGSSGKVHLPIYCSGITDNDPPKLIEFVYDKHGELKKDKNNEPITRSVDTFPLPGESPSGANSALQLIDDIAKSNWGRLYHSPLKTFEYDLAIEGNTSQMAKVLHDLWPLEGTVKGHCMTICSRNNQYPENAQLLKEDAEYIFKHIDVDEVGKGIYAQELTNYLELQINRHMDSINETRSNLIDVYTKISELMVIPEYIKRAIIWACGGIEIDE